MVALSGAALAQGVPARSRPTAPAPARTTAPTPSPTDGQRAQIWAATARFVYADDPALTSIQSELERTIDDGSLRAFGRSLDDAVRVEQRQLPRQNHVLTFQGKFKEVQAQKSLDPNNLPALVAAIEAKLAGNPERMSDPTRKQRLAAFLARLQQLAASPDQAAAPAGRSQGPDPAVALAPADTTPPLLAIGPTPPAATNLPATLDTAPSSTLPMIALVLSALSLLGVLYLLLTRGLPKGGASRTGPEPDRTAVRASRDFSISQYQELRKLVQQEIAATLAAAPAGVGPGNQPPLPPPPQAPPAAPRPETPVSAPVLPVTAPPTPPLPPSLSELLAAEPAPAPVAAPALQLRTIYVNQQPLDGAFRRDNLADAPASYTIFEITTEAQTPDQGTFTVTRNEAAHGGYIGSHHSILEPACVYNYPQGAVSRIITDVPGTVQRLPSGDWHINQKAQIHFA